MFLEIGIALILAKIFGEVLIRLKQPSVIGEVLAGIVFGIIFMSVRGVYGSFVDLGSNEIFDFLASMGIVLLLFISGFEQDIDEIKRSGKCGVITALFGVSFPLFIITYFGIYGLGMPFSSALVLGAIFTPTSVGITVRVLIELGKLDTKAGSTIMTSAIVDDIIAIILISVVIGAHSLATLAFGLIIFFALSLILNKGVLNRIIEMAGRKMHGEYTVVTIALAAVLILSEFAEDMGLAAITGAFVVGIILSQSIERRRIIKPVKAIAYTFLVPLFFVKVGILFEFDKIHGVDPILFLLVPIAIGGKFIGSTLGARISGMNMRTSSIVGVGMVPVMEVELVILTIAIAKGSFDAVSPDFGSQMTSVVIIHVMITSIIIPSILKFLFKHHQPTHI